MAAIDFPNSPTVGQIFTSGTKAWTWDGTTWNATNPRLAVRTVSDSAPGSPVTGDEWYNSSDGRTYIYYDLQWVEVNPNVKGDPGAAGRFTVADTAPISPTTGDTWFSTLNGKQYVYMTNAWIEPNSNLAGIQGNTGATGPSAYPNLVINGGFDFWQRGTSFNDAMNGTTSFSADRWQYVRDGAVSGITVTRQAAGLTGFQYCARVQRNSGDTQTNNFRFGSAFETLNSIPYAGKTITVSFYVRKGADWTGGVGLDVYSGTGTDQATVWNEFTGIYNVISQTVSGVSTAWQRVSYTGVVPTNSTQLGVRFWGTSITGTAGANAYFEITGVQLEEGSTATSFRRAGGDIQGELTKCQRYYYRISGNSFEQMGIGFTASVNTQSRFQVTHPTTMRANPSSMDYSTLAMYDGTTLISVSSATLNTGQTGKNAAWVEVATSASTAFRPQALIANNSTSAYIGFNAEIV